MKKYIAITIIFTLFFICCGCKPNISQEYSRSHESTKVDESSETSESKVPNNSDVFKAVDSTQISTDDYAEALRLSETTIDQYLKSIYKTQEPTFSELIYSDNLRTYLEEKVKISIYYVESLSYSSDIELDSVEVLESELYDTYYFFKLQYNHGGGSSVCYTLVVNDGGILKVADIYFFMKDGFDLHTTGDVRSDRTFDNAEIWNDDEWYKNVMERLSDYKIGSAMYIY